MQPDTPADAPPHADFADDPTHDASAPASAARRRFLIETGALATGMAASGDLEAQGTAQPAPAPPATPGRTASADAMIVRLDVNGREVELTLDPRVTLLDALREHLALNGTKKGCDRGQCGACTVLVDGRRVNACLTLAVAVEGARVITVEGLARGDRLSPVQQAFLEHDAFQCGYCTPGQLCSATALLEEVRAGTASAATADVRVMKGVALDDAEIRERMSGNVCRCGAYVNIVAAVRDAALRSAR